MIRRSEPLAGRRPRWLPIAVLLGGWIAGVPGARAQAPPGAIEGTVISLPEGVPVPQAAVLLAGTPLRALTDDAGTFRLTQIEPGAYTVRVVAFGHAESQLADVRVTPGEVNHLTIELTQTAVEVPGIVVTASRSGARIGESPASVAVLGSDEILRRNVSTLDEALPFAQGVITNAGQLDIRGASGLSRGVGSRVLVLLDGHRLMKGVGSEADLEIFPLLDVDRVEVLKGPNSSLWGTSAVGGVVNVLTSRPPERPETLFRAYYGAWDTPSQFRFTDEALSSQGLGFQHSRRIGRVGGTLYLGAEGSDGFHQNGGHSRWQARLKTVFPGDSDRPTEAFVNFTRRDKDEFFTWLSEERPLEVDSASVGDWLREDDVVIGVTARPVNNQSMLLQVRPQFAYNKVQNHFHDNQDFHRSSRLAADVQLSMNPSRRQAISTGVEASGTEVRSNFLGEPWIVDLAAYAQDEIEISSRWHGTVGLRLDYHHARSGEPELSPNPKIGLVYRPSAGVGLRTSVSRGYRAPSASEQYTSTTQFGFRVIPNLELMGEHAWAAEVGGTAEIGGWLLLDAALFHSDYTDLIEPAPVPGEFFTFQFRNVADARVSGLDAGAQVGLFDNMLALKANYVFLDTEDKRTGSTLQYRSRHNVTATLEVLRQLLAVDVRYRSTVEEVLAFPLDPREPITVVDLRAAYRIQSWIIMAKVGNLFQNTYVDVQERRPGPTRHFRLTIIPRF